MKVTNQSNQVIVIAGIEIAKNSSASIEENALNKELLGRKSLRDAVIYNRLKITAEEGDKAPRIKGEKKSNTKQRSSK